MARAATLVGIVLIAIGCVAGFASAADRARMDEPFEITADRILFDEARDLYVAEGRVRIEQSDRRLKARWVAFSKATRIAVAEGDVQLEDGPDQLRAEFMVFDADSLQGILYQGTLDAGSSGFVVRAKELIRTGQNNFTVRDGVFSTCRCEPGKKLPWEIHAANADVELGGYGTVTNSTFNVLGVPVLWVPWAFFPIKSERETGFLLPDFAFGGRGGAAVGLPFFWAALPQLNVTLTPRYFVERGYKQDVELEYVFGERSGGQLFVAGLRDQDWTSNSTFRKDRWAVLWEHDQELPAKWRWQTDVKLASDNLYTDDFIELRRYDAYRFLESTTNVARDFGVSGGYGAMVAARYADDLQGSTFDDRDEYILQRFGEVRGDVAPGALEAPFGIQTRVDSEVIYFSSLRSVESELSGLAPTAAPALRTNGRFYDLGYNGIVDNPASSGEGNGTFEEGEPLDENGTRIEIHPRFARPFQIGEIAEFVPEVGYLQTLYQSNRQNFAERGLVTARADLRGRLAKDYFGTAGRAVRHIVEPRLSWAFVSQQRQTNNPLFVPRPAVPQLRQRALSLENVTRNPSDRIENANQLVFAVAQRFFVRDRTGRGTRLTADVVTAVDWNFSGEKGLGNLFLDGRLFPVGPMSSRLRAVFNPESAHFSEGQVGLDLVVPLPRTIFRSTLLSTTYRYRDPLPQFTESEVGASSNSRTSDGKLSQLEWTARFELTARIRLTYQGVYSLGDSSGFIRNRGLVEYASKCRCWGIGAAIFHERDQGIGGGLQIRFMGLGDEKSSLFDGGYGTGFNL